MARLLGLCLDYRTANLDSSSSSDSDNDTTSAFPFPTSKESKTDLKECHSPGERVVRSRSGTRFPNSRELVLSRTPLPSPDVQLEQDVKKKLRSTVLLVEVRTDVHFLKS